MNNVVRGDYWWLKSQVLKNNPWGKTWMIIETELGSWYEIAQTFLWPVFTEDGSATAAIARYRVNGLSWQSNNFPPTVKSQSLFCFVWVRFFACTTWSLLVMAWILLITGCLSTAATSLSNTVCQLKPPELNPLHLYYGQTRLNKDELSWMRLSICYLLLNNKLPQT